MSDWEAPPKKDDGWEKPSDDSSYDISEYVEPIKKAGREIARQVGLTGRAAISGITSLPTMIADPLTKGMNVGIRAINDAAGTNISEGALPSETVERAMNAAGLPQPKNDVERIAQAGAASMAGVGAQAGVAGKLARAVPTGAKELISSLSQDVGRQTLGAGLAGVGSQSVAEAGGGPVAQMAAGLTGAILPSAVPYGGAKAVKGLLRGSDENAPKVRANIDTFRSTGAEPTAGQATEGRFARATESALSKMPGSAGKMASKAAEQADQIGAEAEKLADSLSTKATPSQAGLAISKGLKGDGGFLSRFKAGQRALYDKLDSYIKPDAPVKVDNTMEALKSMNADIEGAKNVSKLFKNAKIQAIESAMQKDLEEAQTTGRMPYEAIKKLRTLVGSELESGGLAADVPRSKWKSLYGALSQDLDQAAVATMDPNAVKAMSRANAFSKAGYARIEDVLDNVLSRSSYEDIYKAATSTSDMQAGASKIAGVMKSLQPEERDVVRSAFIRRMGQATAGNQNAEGSLFSAQTFLTNWNKMSPEAKAVMFSGRDGKVAQKLNDIAKVASNIKEGSKVFANPSRTASAGIQIAEVATLGTALATGQYKTAAALLGGAASANLTARLMTNPKFVDWLAKATKMSPAAFGSTLAALPRAMKSESPDVQEDADAYLKAASTQGK
jgi:hypothetical protein